MAGGFGSSVFHGKKEWNSMSKLRGIFLSLGLAAIAGLTASEAHAGTLTITVLAGTTTIYTQSGLATTLNVTTAGLATLNATLTTDGFGGYHVNGLQGSSNNGTTSTTNAFVLTSGSVSVTPGGAGAGTPLTIILNEGGFTAPSSGLVNTLAAFTTANYGSISTGTQSDSGSFTDSSSPPVTQSTGTATADFTGSPLSTGSSSATVPTYIAPFSLTNTLTVSLTAVSGVASGSDGFTGQTTLTATAIPEPASLVMMLTGLPLPLVLLGLLRRRAAAA
jgi:hypothetical protein